MRKTLKTKKGFTLLELILVIGIFAIVTAAAAVSLSSFLTRGRLNINANEIVHTLRKAQSNSIMRIKDSQWGVRFDESSGESIFFKGSTYGERDQNYDEVDELPDSLSFDNISLNGGGKDIIFIKVSGETASYGSLEIKDQNDNKYTISINPLGQIETN